MTALAFERLVIIKLTSIDGRANRGTVFSLNCISCDTLGTSGKPTLQCCYHRQRQHDRPKALVLVETSIKVAERLAASIGCSRPSGSGSVGIGL